MAQQIGSNTPTPDPAGQLQGSPGYAGGAPGALPSYGQSAGFAGQGTYVAPVYDINNEAITGNPSQGASSNYGLNDVWQNLQTAVGQVPNQGAFMTGATQLNQAPQFSAAQVNPAYGTAAVGNAAQGNESAWQAALGRAAQGGASYAGPAYGQAAQGAATYGNAAQMFGGAQGGYATAQSAPISTAGDRAWQAQQQQLANILGNQAAGYAISPADLQLQRGAQQNFAQQLSLLGSQSGPGAGLAFRSLQDQAAAAAANLNQQMGTQRAQETLNAQQALGSVLGTARGQAQSYNLNQAQLRQQAGLFNASNAQQALMQNAQFGQQAGLADLAAQNQQILANQAAANSMTGLNLSNNQAMSLANAGFLQNSGQFNAGQGQGMTLANMNSANQLTGLNLANLNAQNAGNAQLSQQMGLANLSNDQAMALENLRAQNTFGLNNMGNAQGANMANMGAQNQINLANQALLAQYGLTQSGYNQQSMLANQKQAYENQQLRNQELNALLGAQTGIGQSNRAASLAAQQLQIQQMLGTGQINEQAYAGGAQSAANLATAGINAAAGLVSAGLAAWIASQKSSGNKVTQNADGTYSSSDGQTYDPGATSPPISTGEGSTPATENPPQPDYGNAPVDNTPPVENSGGGSGYSEESVTVPWATNPYTYTPPYSDENLKAGISDANPMMDSFMRAMKESSGPSETMTPTKDVAFRNPQRIMTKAAVIPNNTGATSTGAGLAGTIFGGIAGLANPILGAVVKPAMTGLVNAIGQQADKNTGMDKVPVTEQWGYQPAQYKTVEGTGSGLTETGGVDTALEQPTWGTSAISDDQQKAGAISANAYMQGALDHQQAMSQQYGGFPSWTGQQPMSQPYGEFPPWEGPNPNAGYGMSMGPEYGPQINGGTNWTGGFGPGGVYGGGIVDYGGFGGGGFMQGGSDQGGLMSSGGYSPANGAQIQGGIMAGAGLIPGGTSGGGQVGGFDQTMAYQAPPMPVNPTLNPSPYRANNDFYNHVAPAGISGQAIPGSGGPASFGPVSNGNGFYVPPSQIIGLGYQPQSPTVSGNSGSSGNGISSGPSGRVNPVTLSDERQKTDVAEMLDQLHAYQYRYKDPTLPGAAPGKHVGVMAQDLEKSPLGATMVENTPYGKKVNYGQALGTMMAGQAYLNDRLNEHERMLKRRG